MKKYRAAMKKLKRKKIASGRVKADDHFNEKTFNNNFNNMGDLFLGLFGP